MWSSKSSYRKGPETLHLGLVSQDHTEIMWYYRFYKTQELEILCINVVSLKWDTPISIDGVPLNITEI